MATDYWVNVLLYPTSQRLSLWRCHPGWGTAHSWESLRSYRRHRTKALLSSLRQSSWSSRSHRPRRNILETQKKSSGIAIYLLHCSLKTTVILLTMSLPLIKGSGMNITLCHCPPRSRGNIDQWTDCFYLSVATAKNPWKPQKKWSLKKILLSTVYLFCKVELHALEKCLIFFKIML